MSSSFVHLFSFVVHITLMVGVYKFVKFGSVELNPANGTKAYDDPNFGQTYFLECCTLTVVFVYFFIAVTTDAIDAGGPSPVRRLRDQFYRRATVPMVGILVYLYFTERTPLACTSEESIYTHRLEGSAAGFLTNAFNMRYMLTALTVMIEEVTVYHETLPVGQDVFFMIVMASLYAFAAYYYDWGPRSPFSQKKQDRAENGSQDESCTNWAENGTFFFCWMVVYLINRFITKQLWNSTQLFEKVQRMTGSSSARARQLILQVQQQDGAGVRAALENLQTAKGINVGGGAGWTALHEAAIRPDRTILLDIIHTQGINLNAKDKDGRTAIYCAVRYGILAEKQRQANIDTLIAAGASTLESDDEEEEEEAEVASQASAPQHVKHSGGTTASGMFSDEEGGGAEDDDDSDAEEAAAEKERDDLELALQLQQEKIPKNLQFDSPGRKSTLGGPSASRLRSRRSRPSYK